MPSKFCAAPFLHSFVSTHGKKFLCCWATRWSYDDRWSNDTDFDLEDWEGEDYQKIREHMLEGEGWLPACGECKQLEDLGQESLRQWFDQVWEENGKPSLNVVNGNSFGVPISYDLRFNNLCNLSCRMCMPESSSQLAKEAERHPDIWPNWQEHSEEFKVALSSDKDIEWILEEAQFVRVLKILGGEPTLQPQAKQLLQKLIDVGNTNIDLKITTNGTNVNKEFYDLITQFKNVRVGISIDTHPDRLAYIRGGANGKKIWENIRKISELSWADRYHISTTQVIVPYNVFDFWELGQLAYETPWIDQHYSEVVYEPFYQSIVYMPEKWKQKAIDIAKENECYEDEIHIFNAMMSHDENIELMKQLKSHTQLTDFARNKYLKDYHPICHDMLEEIE